MEKYTVEIDEHGNKIWFNEKGQRHREDGPACEFVVGSKFWYKHGKLHREDGPAMELVNGAKEWWLNDQHYTEKEFNAKMNPSKVIEMTMAEINKMAGCKVKIIESH